MLRNLWRDTLSNAWSTFNLGTYWDLRATFSSNSTSSLRRLISTYREMHVNTVYFGGLGLITFCFRVSRRVTFKGVQAPTWNVKTKTKKRPSRHAHTTRRRIRINIKVQQRWREQWFGTTSSWTARSTTLQFNAGICPCCNWNGTFSLWALIEKYHGMVTVVVVFIYTPNCKNVVHRKMKKGKSQIGL